MERIEILTFNGFDELDVVAPFEILASAGFAVDLVTIEECPNIVSAHGMSVYPQRVLGAVRDLLVVPGGGWAAKAPTGAWGEVRRGVLPAAIARRHAADSQIAGVCTGAMLLASLFEPPGQ